MNLLNASCLRGRYNVLPRIAIFPLLVASPLRSSSLSAIHRGIRNSEKVSAQGHSYASSSRGKTNKAKKGGKGKDKGKGAGKGKKNNKKDDGNSGKKSRKARFNDPDDPFGQNSLVFQLKNVGGKDAGKSAGGKRNPNLLTPDQFMKDFMSSPTQGKKSGTAASVPPAARPPPPSARAPPAASPPPPPPVRAPPAAASPPPPPPARAPPAAASPPPPAQPAGFWSPPPPSGGPQSAGAPKQPSYEPSRDTPREPSHTPSWGQTIPQDDGPVRITRTTAASQFLYGRSSVEAALKRSRRKLYALYIYNDLVEAMAKSRGIPIKRVSSEGLRMMDKMSENRPHNGYILEVSPLPQLPVKGLGPVSTDPKKPGFGLVLNYQSPEEQEINGASEFVPSALPAGRMPFVLLLDGIQDPGNLGAIIRSAAFLGADAIAVTKGASSPITAVSVKTSAGAAEIVTLLSVVSPVEFITSSRAAGWVTYAAVSPESARSRGNSHFTLDRIESYDPLATQPTLLVLGSEGEGLTRSVRRCTDFQVSIPNHSQAPSLIDSLNVSVAAGILCSGFLRKQYLGQSTKEPEPSQLF
ncbi:Alpha/beta knot methyltransferase [Durotheca rogersii]|uniref:Alpha/beta knot methyltransferase n=1 Tax=Durotheca rogersii TaxID=419775 RepID=UPI002220ABCF|nr:Alpha/beta knot methyltransferase [Durotheca rogersii]KAI5859735.1 Alpha/beta knot methyltransferase [Durotheca rogersii]